MKKKPVEKNIFSKTKSLTAEFFNVGAIVDAFDAMEVHGLSVKTINVSPKMYSNFRKIGRGIIEVETFPPNIRSGLMGTMLGAKIMLDKSVSDDTILLMSKEESGPVMVKLVVKSTSKSLAKVSSSLETMNSKLLSMTHTVDDILKTLGRAKEIK